MRTNMSRPLGGNSQETPEGSTESAVSETPQLRFAALVRGEDGGLSVRWFATPEDAMKACSAHEAPRPVPRKDQKHMTRTSDLAHDLDMKPERIRKWVLANRIPHISNGPRTMMLPNRICSLIKLYGLMGVRAMQLRGEL